VIYYLPLEPYPERYTELLTRWTEDRFRQRGVEFTTILGTRMPANDGIKIGQVLDGPGRCHFALTQMAALTKYIPAMTRDDVVYFDDMFTPGYEALPYVFAQMPEKARPRIYARNHAQSVDPDDFTFPMRSWMRCFEHLVYKTADGIICGSTVHKELMQVALLDKDCHIDVLGLPYDQHDVLRIAGPVPSWQSREKRVVYSSRLDKEKQPHFFFDVLLAVRRLRPDIVFEVCTGSKELRSNAALAVDRALALEAGGHLVVHRGTTKETYYGVVKNARVQLNTARQDFISYTAIEASTLGTVTVAPAFRSFPETFANDHRVLYVPWSVADAAELVIRRVDSQIHPADVGQLSHLQHRTLDRIIDLLLTGFSQPWTS
jgi:glycosyltransferase involved in cell wall biosynthesis